MNSTTITRILQSRGMAVFTAMVCGAAVWWAFSSGTVVEITGNRGPALPSPNLWIASPEASMWTALGLTFGTAALMMTLNSMYNFIRSISVVFASIFLLMEMAVPDMAAQLYSGTMVVLTVLLCVMMLFSCYGGAGGNRRIFLIFFLLALGATSMYSLLLFIPVFAIGLMQMRVLTPRTCTAAAIGLITPLWILQGFGIIDVRRLQLPEFTSIFTSIDTGEALHLVIIVAATAAVGIGSWVMNFTKMIAYNARNRAFNGFITLLMFSSMLMMAVDYSNLTAYLPVFNMCAAFQAGHLIAMRQKAHGYIFICCLWALYLTFYLWRMFV